MLESKCEQTRDDDDDYDDEDDDENHEDGSFAPAHLRPIRDDVTPG